MSTGIAPSEANAALDARIVTGTTYYVQLHVGDPGAAGTANPASNTTREAVTFAAAASGAKGSDSAPTWAGVPADETYTHWTLWTAASAGSFKWSGTITNGAVTTGDDFDLPAGDLSLTMTGAA